MNSIGHWIQGAIAALIGIIALVAAGRTDKGQFLTTGIVIFIAAIAYIAFLIKDHWDEKDSTHA